MLSGTGLIVRKDNKVNSIHKNSSANDCAEHDIIYFYGRKFQEKSSKEIAEMSADEKREYLLLKYKPVCLKAAKQYKYAGAEFADLYMDACAELLKVLDEFGVDDPDISYHLLSRIAIKVKRAGDAVREEYKHLSFDDDTVLLAAVSIHDFCSKADEFLLLKQLSEYLNDSELELVKLILENEKLTQKQLAECLGVSRSTVVRRLAAIRRKLAPVRSKFSEADSL